MPFLLDAARIFYWGDLDARGFEIANEYRRFGVRIETVLMDMAALNRYAAFRAETDERGRPLKRSARKTLTHLTSSELEAYETLTDPEWSGPIRVEQERIPLKVALGQVQQLRDRSA